VNLVAPEAPSFDELPLPRRVAITVLAAEIVARERTMADLYAEFARDPGPPGLRAGLEELALEKRQQAAAAALGLPAGGDLAAPPRRRVRVPAGPAIARRAETFREAFEGERALEVSYRELTALVADIGGLPGLGDLAARAARHRTRLRDLYLRYS
jgi:hypothetical protein